MTHRAESILAAVKTALNGLTTVTSTNVVRGRVWPTTAAAALSVDMGPDLPVGAPNVAYQDMLLEVVITASTKAAQGATDTALNAIAAEVYAAIMATPRLGLSYVHNTTWLGRGVPDRDNADQAISTQDLRFRVHYRHSYTSAEA